MRKIGIGKACVIIDSVSYFQENVRKTGSKVRPIDVKLLLSGEVHVMATRAIYFDTGGR